MDVEGTVSPSAARESTTTDPSGRFVKILWISRTVSFREHRQEQLKDTKRQSDPFVRLQHEGVFWSRVIGVLF